MGSPNPPEGSEGISLLPRSWGWKTSSFSNQFTLICVSEGVSERSRSNASSGITDAVGWNGVI
ncbi:hypothetical protein Isop_2699 [Isosphaera pallida ATCC 43644]|uniref:Uncharacterized protein n=1 Tax=Isosphaera pallida (strain ATCC 43644 / DSM 9630 / IS1B) TaxID=575540 RepID=E8QZX7_ISOPI|nr:hypothetical protein Isop_2699 [Isosphaera pallida ATCC 43644]